MIAISTTQKHFELRLRFSFAWLEKAINKLGSILSLHQVKEIERHKEKTMHEAGFYTWPMKTN